MYKVKLPTQYKTKQKLIKCPWGCTQHRTKSYNLAERKTFDVTLNKCSNCGFSKLPAIAKFHGVKWNRASDLVRK